MTYFLYYYIIIALPTTNPSQTDHDDGTKTESDDVTGGKLIYKSLTFYIFDYFSKVEHIFHNIFSITIAPTRNTDSGNTMPGPVTTKQPGIVTFFE